MTPTPFSYIPPTPIYEIRTLTILSNAQPEKTLFQLCDMSIH